MLPVFQSRLQVSNKVTKDIINVTFNSHCYFLWVVTFLNLFYKENKYLYVSEGMVFMVIVSIFKSASKAKSECYVVNNEVYEHKFM